MGILVLVAAAGTWFAFRSRGTTKVEVAVGRVRRGEFIDSVRTRGEIKSSNSVTLNTPRCRICRSLPWRLQASE